MCKQLTLFLLQMKQLEILYRERNTALRTSVLLLKYSYSIVQVTIRKKMRKMKSQKSLIEVQHLKSINYSKLNADQLLRKILYY